MLDCSAELKIRCQLLWDAGCCAQRVTRHAHTQRQGRILRRELAARGCLYSGWFEEDRYVWISRLMINEAAIREDSSAAPCEPKPAAPRAGEILIETLDYDGGRQVTVYLPPGPPGAIVFAGDGQLISQWGADLEAADVPPTMIVGVHRIAGETLRLHEYSPVFDPERFAAHEKFFVDDVRHWTRSRFGVALPTGRTAVYGVSGGGELALAIGLRHPDIYGAIFCASPGAGYKPPGKMPSPIPRTYLVAGTREPFFLENATHWASALRDAGADVVMSERHAGHDDAMWRNEFPLMVAWAFGR